MLDECQKKKKLVNNLVKPIFLSFNTPKLICP